MMKMMVESRWQWIVSSFEIVRDSQLFGMFLMAVAGVLLTLSNLFVQLAIDANKKRIPTLEIVFSRSVVQLVLTIPCLIYNRVRLSVDRDILPTITIMGICGFLSVTFIYLGIDKVPLGDATVIMFTSPVFTTLFAYMFLSESCTGLDGICGLISFAGVIISSRPDFIFGERSGHISVMFQREKLSHSKREALYLMGMGFILLGAVFLSLYYVLTRKIGQTHSYLINIFYPSLFGTICIPLMMLPFSHLMFPNCWRARLHIFMVGLTAFLGLILLARALKLENAGPLILIRNLDIIYAFVFQYCFMGIAPSWWSIGGGLVVMAATTIIIAKRWSIWGKDRGGSIIDEEEMVLLGDNADYEK